MDKTISTELVRNEEVLHREKEERNILQKVKERIFKWIGQFSHRNYILKDVMEGKIEGRM
jgi:hypothetical protein